MVSDFAKEEIRPIVKKLDKNGNFPIGIAVGISKAAYQKAMAYSNDRIAFDKPINHFQLISFKLADMVIKIEAPELLVYHFAWLKDKWKNYIKEVPMTKLYASETVMKITREAIQIHGGYGYVHGNVVESFFRNAKILEIVEGTSEIQRVMVFKETIRDKSV